MSTKLYKVNEIKQLIELNGDKTNFEINFEIKSQNNDPFKAVVISESDLNSGEKIEYQSVDNGYISGNVVNNKDVYQSYFLLLKSDKPTECEVTVNLKEIPVNVEFQQQEMLRQRKIIEEQIEKQNKFDGNHNQNNQNIKSVQNKSGGGINILLILGILAIVGIGIWIFMSSKKNKSLPEINMLPDSGIIPDTKIVPEINLPESANIISESILEIKLPESINILPEPVNILSESVNILSEPVNIPISSNSSILNQNNLNLANKLKDYFKTN